MSITILHAKRLCLEHLEAVLEGRADVLRVPKYYPLGALRSLVGRLDSSDLRGPYDNAPDISRVGRAFFEKQASPAAALDYEANSLNWIASIREAVSPLLSPMDKLRVELDEIWPHGATVATLDGKRAFCGLIRIFPPGSCAEPHMDVLAWDMRPGHPDAMLSGQLAANVYCQMPATGGELLIWSRTMDQDEYEAARGEDSYGVSRVVLGEPAACIRPTAGELIIFNSRLVHAVSAGEGGDRVTSSAFIGFKTRHDPLPLWS